MLLRVQSKQDMAAITLDANRNRMIPMNLNLTIGGISLAFAKTVAAFFGMNIQHELEYEEGAFPLIHDLDVKLSQRRFDGAFDV